MAQAYFYDDYRPVAPVGASASPRQRISVRRNVYLPAGDVDPRTGELRRDAPPVGRVQAKRTEYERLEEEYMCLEEVVRLREDERKHGRKVSLRATVWVAAFLLFLLAGALLGQRGVIAQKQLALNDVRKSIEVAAEKVAQTQRELVDASNSSSIMYTASHDLGLIPASEAVAIHLAAMDTRPMSAVTATASQETPTDVAASAAEPDATAIPALAMNHGS